MAADDETRVLPIVLLGADALLAARPYTPVQLAHACLAAGFDAAYPVSWGDELIAADCLSRLGSRDRRPLALCACPYAQRACDAAGWPAETLIVASPPVAAARLVRAAYAERMVRITYVGACPSGVDSVIDEQVLPEQFLRRLLDRGIVLAGQPESYESVLPPDRRRFLSMPGGAPSAEQLAGSGWSAGGLASLRSASPGTLADPAPEVGCVCSGAPRGRAAVVALEPPRASAPVLDPLVEIDLAVEPIDDRVAAAPKAPDASEPVPVPVDDLRGTTHPTEPTTPSSDATGEVGSPVPPLGARRPSMHPPSPRHEIGWSEPVWPQRLEEVHARRGFTLATVLLAAALGLALPFAAVGGWLLYRDGPGVMRIGRGSAGPTTQTTAPPVLAPPSDTPYVAVARDSSSIDDPLRVVVSDSASVSSTPAAGAVENDPEIRQQSLVERSRDARSITPAGRHLATRESDTAAGDAAAVRADIRRRMARIDSLNRVVESLTRAMDSLRRPQPPHRPLR